MNDKQFITRYCMLFIALAFVGFYVSSCRLEAEPTDVTITLLWTATGDDYAVGTAHEYDLRYNTEVITESNWGASTPIPLNMQPKPSGQPESVTVGLTAESEVEHYFAIKVADEKHNWSRLSNVIAKIWTDTIPPIAITDLRDTI